MKRKKSEREQIAELSETIKAINRDYPLPRCKHGNALQDGAGDKLAPSCGCWDDDTDKHYPSYSRRLSEGHNE